MDGYTTLAKRYPQIVGAIYFNVDMNQVNDPGHLENWILTMPEDGSALEAYKRLLGQRRFKGTIPGADPAIGGLAGCRTDGLPRAISITWVTSREAFAVPACIDGPQRAHRHERRHGATARVRLVAARGSRRVAASRDVPSGRPGRVR